MKSRCELQLDTREAEEFTPKRTSEHWITVTYDRGWNAMETHHLREESSCHRHCCIRVSQGDEVICLGETINDCQDDRFPMHFGQYLDEIMATLAQTMDGTSNGCSNPPG